MHLGMRGMASASLPQTVVVMPRTTTRTAWRSKLKAAFSHRFTFDVGGRRCAGTDGCRVERLRQQRVFSPPPPPVRQRRSTVHKAAVLPPQPHMCEPSRAAKPHAAEPVATLRLSNVLPSPLARVRVGTGIQVIAAYHRKATRVPWVTGGAQLVCRVASCRGQGGEAYLTVRATAKGDVAFQSLGQQATAAMIPALQGRLAIS